MPKGNSPKAILEPKPSPEGINVALKHLNISSSETFYIGDHINDLDAGANAGVRIIACYYGYSLNSKNNCFILFEKSFRKHIIFGMMNKIPYGCIAILINFDQY